ncbi:putative E3 ubiquitin-protein ligase XBAT34 isoform X2 [Wolffia australiana]
MSTDTQTWTAIQMAARKGLLQTVNMLLLHGANPLIHLGSERNALEIARHKGFVEIVCAIERNICFFSGWLRNFHDTDHGAWEKIWAVVLPGGTSLSMDVTKLKIAIYHHHHHAKPSKTLSIRHYTFRRPDFSHHDPELVLVDNSIFASGAPLTLRSGKEGDTEQLKLLYNACIGMIRTNNYFRAATEPAEDVGSISQEESETAAAMVTSIQTATAEGVPISVVGFKGQGDVTDCDSFPLTKKEWINEKSTTTLSSSCVICTDNCADTVCVPCGHLSGCMACLREVERKKIGCPVCRAHIERILKIYTV